MGSLKSEGTCRRTNPDRISTSRSWPCFYSLAAHAVLHILASKTNIKNIAVRTHEWRVWSSLPLVGDNANFSSTWSGPACTPYVTSWNSSRWLDDVCWQFPGLKREGAKQRANTGLFPVDYGCDTVRKLVGGNRPMWCDVVMVSCASAFCVPEHC